MQVADCERAYRDALADVPTGVFVMAGHDPSSGGRFGVTCNSYASVSLQPRLIAWSLSGTSRQFRHFTSVRHFAISVLSADQEAIAKTFASTVEDRFAGVRTLSDRFGSPLIEGACVHLSCETLFQTYGGDHVTFVAQVHDARRHERAPLLYFRRGFLPLGLGVRAAPAC